MRSLVRTKEFKFHGRNEGVVKLVRARPPFILSRPFVSHDISRVEIESGDWIRDGWRVEWPRFVGLHLAKRFFHSKATAKTQ